MGNGNSFDGVITGVGGQGVLFLTEILGYAAIEQGLEALSSEVHGMAQRGGVVTSFVRVGHEIYASTLTEGLADCIVALEPAEALRVLRYANSSTAIILNKNPIVPPSVSLGLNRYPKIELIVEECEKITKRVTAVDAISIAGKAGSTRIQNIVMLGCLAATGLLPISLEVLKTAIGKKVRSEYLTINLKAFNFGFQAMEERK